MHRGYIKEYRKIVDWEWYTDVNTCHLFRHCLYKANIEDKKWRGQFVARGSFITSLEHLSHETGLSIQQVRTALNKLKSTNELTSTSTSHNTVITVNNYDLYQDINMRDNKRITNEQQTNNKQITTTKECKEYKNEKNIREREREILEKYLLNRKKAKPIENIDAYIDNIKPDSLKRLIEKAYKWQDKQTEKTITPIETGSFNNDRGDFEKILKFKKI